MSKYTRQNFFIALVNFFFTENGFFYPFLFNPHPLPSLPLPYQPLLLEGPKLCFFIIFYILSIGFLEARFVL